MRVARVVSVERVRLRVARDPHDELGAHLSRLAILGDVAQRDLSWTCHVSDQAAQVTLGAVFDVGSSASGVTVRITLPARSRGGVPPAQA